MTGATDLPDLDDPFGTAALRAAVLGSWQNSPTRFREDANAEEDLLLGGYGDRWLVELAQNAADAAARADVAGRLWVRLADTADGPELRVANTGAPLDGDGVAALAALRASAKRDTGADAVGRFGVGFAAVLPVSAEPRIVSAGAGVAFSTSRTAAEVAALPGPAAELARRDGQLPVLRLAWPAADAADSPPDGYDTEVGLPLRPGHDGAALLADALAAAGDLLLALPTLAEIRVGEVRLRREDGPDGTVGICGDPGGDRRWLLVRRSGTHAAELLLGGAVEQRRRADWAVSWALPLAPGDGDGDDGAPGFQPVRLAPDVLHAPTPSDERLSLPARLFATVPMEPSRRRVQSGPVTDAVLVEAGAAYVALVRRLPPGRRAMLIPAPGFPASELDGRLRAAVLDALRSAAWLPAADGGELAPADAVLLDLPGDALPSLLAEVIPGLVAADAGPATTLATVGVQRLGAAEIVDRLAGLSRPPSWWAAVYAGLQPAVEQGHTQADELGALAVPLVDGRLVTGPRSCAFRGGEPYVSSHLTALAALGLPGLRLIHPDAMHPLLTRLGAQPTGADELLDHPAVGEAVARSVDDAQDGLDTRPLADAVLALVAESGAGDRPWLGALALPDSLGEPRRADELVLPDAVIRPLLADDAPLGVLAAELAAGVGREVLTSIGVLDGFAVLIDEQPTGPDHDLDDEQRWWSATTAAGATPQRLVAVRDLDLVADDAWPAALAALAADPDSRATVRRQPGEPPSYTAWWLAEYARLGGRRLREWRLPTSDGPAGLFDPVPAEAADLDAHFLAAIGVRAEVAVADDADAADLLDRLADPARLLDAETVRAVHAALADAVLADRVDADAVDPPRRVRSVAGDVVDARDASVLDQPWLAEVLPERQLVAGGDPAALAELLDLPLASEQVSGVVLSTGRLVRWVGIPEVALACETISVPVPSGELWLHERLDVDVKAPQPGVRQVTVWRDEHQRLHTSDPVRALLARLGEPPDR